MAHFSHPYITEVADLGLPRPDEVMITHGSALVVRGIRSEHPDGDIDLVVTPPNMSYLREELGWRALKTARYREVEIQSTLSPDLRFDAFSHDFVPEMYQRSTPPRGRVYPERLFTLHDARFDQDDDTGIWVASALFVQATKRGTNRKKDHDDIRRIDQYLNIGY